MSSGAQCSPDATAISFLTSRPNCINKLGSSSGLNYIHCDICQLFISVWLALNGVWCGVVF